MTRLQCWHIDPRDPLVFDSGARVGAPISPVLPPQPSLAGCVRGAFFEAERPPGKEADAFARRLLDIEVRGPWLTDTSAKASPESHKGRSGSLARLPHFLVPCPADLGALMSDDEKRSVRALVAAELQRLGDDEGVLLPGGTPAPRHLLGLPARVPSEDAGNLPVKVDSLGDHALTLADAVSYALDVHAALDGGASIGALKPRRVFEAEPRTHVSLRPDTLTADPEQLFVSRGRRLLPGLRISVDVASPEALRPPVDGPVCLGGEGRVSLLTIAAGHAWPGFDAVRDLYAAEIRSCEGRPLALRLALLTPGDFGDSSPPPVLAPDGRALPLLTACHARFLPVSGWDLRHRQPRAVRRLVPAGAVYLFEIPTGTDVLALCEHFWARPLRSSTADPSSTLAPPQRDGYALTLPGLRLLPALEA